MNKKQISSLVENFLNQARVTGLTLAHIGFSYTTLHNKKFAVSSHLEILPSVGFGIPYYGSLTFGMGGEITVSNLPTSVKKVTLNKNLINKMELLSDYGTFADDKFKVDEVKDKPVNEYFKDFSKAFVSTTDSVSVAKMNDDIKTELQKSIPLSSNTSKGLLVITHADNIEKLNDREFSSTSLALNIQEGEYGIQTLYTDPKVPNFVNSTNTTRVSPNELTIAAFEVVQAQKQLSTSHSVKLLSLEDKISRFKQEDGKVSFNFNRGDLRDEKKVDLYLTKIPSVQTAYQAWESASKDEKSAKKIEFDNALSQFGKECNLSSTPTGETVSSVTEVREETVVVFKALDSEALRTQFHTTITENITEYFQDKANSGAKVNINASEFKTSDKINTFFSNIANFNISMANTISANVVMPYNNDKIVRFDIGAQGTQIDGPYFDLNQVDTRRFSGLVHLYKGFNVNLHINKGIGDVIKGFSISAHISLSEYIKDSWKAKMYYNFFNTQKKERTTEILDYNTAKEIASSIKTPKFSEQFKKVANDDANSSNSSLKTLEDRDWADVSGIDKDYENVLNVHSAGNKVGVTVYPYILNGDGINITFIIPALNISKLKDFWFFKLSYVTVLAGNPLCDDGVSIQSSYKLDSSDDVSADDVSNVTVA